MLPTTQASRAAATPLRTWRDVYFFARTELRLSDKQFWKLGWVEYEWKVWQFQLQLARQREPFRDMQAQMSNMMRGEGDEPVQPHELYYLATDRFNDALQQQAQPDTQVEHLDAAAERMQAKGLF